MPQRQDYDSLPTCIADDGRAARFTWGTVFFLFRHGTGLADFDAVARECDEMAKKHRKMLLVVISDASTSNQGAPSTERIRAETQRLAPYLYGQATIILGTGFLASALIAIAGAIMRILPGEYPRAIFRNGNDAVPFVREQLFRQGESARRDQVENALAYVISRKASMAPPTAKAG